ncbi:MAG: TldD/PmbA family protein [Candidatus Dadabacteria bacterium]|nr:MAG: TldD/PmbA family protein [Candidatus Dadabacteria bacterium]
MLTRSTIEKIIPLLKKDLRRAMKMKVPGFPRPYYCAYTLRDIHWFNTWASSGSTYRRRSDQTRNVYCDLRVGSYRNDQVMDGGLLDNDEELESVSHVSVPIDDKCYDGLRIAIWKLTEAKFREALTDYNSKQSMRVSTVDKTRKYPSFVRVKPRVFKTFPRFHYVDEDKWVRFCKRISKWLSELPDVGGNWVEFDASQQTKIFVNTEGSVIVQHFKVFSLMAGVRNLTSEGAQIEQEYVLNCSDPRELPTMRELKEILEKKYERMCELVKAKKMHAYSGPVLLYPKPAGLLLHEALGHRLEGSRLLSSGEGQTFKGQIGKKVVKAPLTVRDDPTLKKFQGIKCIGAYDFDDEGTPAMNTLLIENGVLVGFLNTRQALSARGHVPNGHARNKKFQRPISRMAVTIFEGGEDALSMEEMKALLIQEIRRQKKPFGLIVYETSGGETETTAYDFQGFYGEISYATKVYPDGREVPIRGVDFVGTPLQALNNIVAIGKDQEIDNGYCGAESGFIPITTISPALLLSNLELQAKDEELVTQYILPRPKL